MIKLILSFGIVGLLLIGCGKSKIKTYTLAEKEVYLHKANSGDKEAKKFVEEKMNEAYNTYKESAGGNQTAYKEWQEWMKVFDNLWK